ncbi:MAG: hypothetical protein M3463_01785 [Verrucomicrobiota bacterium]|nr:hypothetical protein [Verrucomicrobiota bacterium]
MRRRDYIRRLGEAIKSTHGCTARHVGTKPVVEVFRGEVAWDGDVEVFNISGHPKARRCYAWGYDDEGTFRITAVLELPPVDSPEAAVKVAIAAKACEQ